MSFTLAVQDISDTAFLTAAARALEGERPDAHLRDPYARMLAGDRGIELLRRLPGGQWTAASCVIRTVIIDDMINQSIQEDQIDTIVNLGAGLDARAYRMQLAPSLRWFEVDRPAILEYKAGKLEGRRPVCSIESISLDATDAAACRALLKDIAIDARRALVLTEGLLAYLTAEQVATLALSLSAEAEFGLWLTDLISPAALWLMNNGLGRSPDARDVTLQFALEDPAGFFRELGWGVEASRSCLAEGERLDRWFLDRAVLSAPLSSAQWEVMRKLFTVVRLRRVD